MTAAGARSGDTELPGRLSLTRKQVQRELHRIGFAGHIMGSNVRALRNLADHDYPKYTGVMEFLGRLATHIRFNYSTARETLIELDFPSLGSLKNIDFTRLMRSDDAMREVFSRCLDTSNGIRVQLRELAWIYQQYAITSPGTPAAAPARA